MLFDGAGHIRDSLVGRRHQECENHQLEDSRCQNFQLASNPDADASGGGDPRLDGSFHHAGHLCVERHAVHVARATLRELPSAQDPLLLLPPLHYLDNVDLRIRHALRTKQHLTADHPSSLLHMPQK